jgi:hypothetical protein
VLEVGIRARSSGSQPSREVWSSLREAPGPEAFVTFRTLLITSFGDGAHPKQIQVHLGHSSIRVTMDVYGHLFPNDMERMAQVRDGRIREACAQLSRTSRGLRPFELGDGGGSGGGLPAETVVELRGFEPLTS